MHDDGGAIRVEDDSGPGLTVTRVVTALSVAAPAGASSRFGRSPMWNGWLASGSVLLGRSPDRSGRRPAAMSGSQLPTRGRCDADARLRPVP